MRKVNRWLLAFGLIAAIAIPVLAQRGGGGGGFGPGGLLTNKSVQQELKMTDEQIKKVEEVVKDIGAKHKDERDALKGIEDKQARIEKGRELEKVVSTEVMKGVTDVLKPEQLKRFKQIQTQMRGPRAFGDSELVADLKLTDEQKEKIKTINDDAGAARKEIFTGGGGFNEETRKKLADLNKETMDKITAVLTDDQKKAWKEMVGDPFEVKFEARPNGGKGKKAEG